MRIWDLHCHLSGVPGLTPEERLGNLLRIADRVHFLGILDHDLLPPVLSAADAMVLPSSSEGLANAWIEALPAGWHKDQAYAQLAITSEHHYKSPEQRDAAIAKVTDAGIRADLDAWRESRKKQ